MILIKRLIKEHIGKYKKYFIAALLFMILSSVSTAALPYLLKPVFNEIMLNGNIKNLMLLCLSVFIAFTGKGIGGYGESVLMTYVGQKLISDIQYRIFSHILSLDMSFFYKTTRGELLSRVIQDVQMMRNSVSNVITGFFRDTTTLIGLIFVMLYMDVTLTLVSLVVFPIAVFPIINLGKRMKKATINVQKELANLSDHFIQVFHCIRVVKGYCQEKFEKNRAKNHIKKVFELVYKTSKIRNASHPIIEVLAGFAIVSIIGYGGVRAMDNKEHIGEFVSFMGALLLIYEPIKRLSQLNSSIQEGLACAERIFGILNESPKISSGPIRAIRLDGKISIENVYFSYSKEKEILKSIDIEIPKGAFVAFVGPSGAGKSTLINLVPRFFDPTEGVIRIDNIDIRDLNIQDLRSNIAIVSQETSLFDGTIFENIAYGGNIEIKNDRKTEIDVINAAKLADAHKFILELPNQYNTRIGEDGIMLSGGQRQRISIARAILKDAPILLLDEATSSLDSKSEQSIQRALKNLVKGRTTLKIAHRLSTIKDSDFICVMSDGMVVEKGTHEELFMMNGLYSSLLKAQILEDK